MKNGGPPTPTTGDLDDLLLGSVRSLRGSEVADVAGLDLATARRYWRALGFADAGDAVAFTDEDAEVLRQVGDLITAGAIDEQTAIQLVRALGRGAARLAEWQVQTLTELVEQRETSGLGSGSRLLTAYGLAARVLPVYERALILAWRRHLSAAAGQYVEAGAHGDDEDGLLTRTLTVGFADLVSFTRISRGLTEEELADVVEVFEAVTSDVIAAHGATVVKTLGDEVMFVAHTGDQAASIAFDIVTGLAAHAHVPAVKVGMATGSVVLRLGDVFGTPANLAARLRSRAEPNTVLIDHATSLELDRERWSWTTLAPVDLPGLGQVAPIELARRQP